MPKLPELIRPVFDPPLVPVSGLRFGCDPNLSTVSAPAPAPAPAPLLDPLAQAQHRHKLLAGAAAARPPAFPSPGAGAGAGAGAGGAASPSLYEMAALTSELDTNLVTTKVKEILLQHNVGQKVGT